MKNEKELIVLILAAGKGTRMESDMPKVLHKINGRPMLDYVLENADKLGADRKIVVIGHKGEMVKEFIAGRAETVVQEPQMGTGHAVMCAESKIEGSEGTILMVYGDVPMLKALTLSSLIEAHEEQNNSGTILTAFLDDATGYGRIIRDDRGNVEGIVEHKDANNEQRKIKEFNTGICCFNIRDLFIILKEITNNNSQKEYYITDAFGLMKKRGWKIGTSTADDPSETEGINTLEQLKRAERIMAEI